MSRERILKELEVLREGRQAAELLSADRDYVLYRSVPTGGLRFGLPDVTDVIVPVPNGYPGAAIDLAGLPSDSLFLRRVKGGPNSQGIVQIDGRTWQLASYHPHQNGGGGPWDQMKHGFHTYLDQLIAWLHQIS